MDFVEKNHDKVPASLEALAQNAVDWLGQSGAAAKNLKSIVSIVKSESNALIEKIRNTVKSFSCWI